MAIGNSATPPMRKSRIELATDIYVITPSDSANLDRWSVITTNQEAAVKVKVTTAKGNDVVILLRGGVPSLVAVKKVWATGGDSLSGVTILGLSYDGD